MRLRRLDLVRYGKFTGATVDFGAAVAGQPDLHVVYGANEAGKSTTLNAWLDLLFGIEQKSNYDFLHDYKDMLIGAQIETGEVLVRVQRKKGIKNTLLDEAGQPLPDSVLLSSLGGLTRDGLREMFSLNDEGLKDGGNSILAGEGEVGELLFSSGAGLAGFTSALSNLRNAPDPFFRPSTQKVRLVELKADLASVETERARLDTDARGYKRLQQALTDAQAALDVAQAARAVPVAALQAVRRNLAALPALRTLEAVEARLAEMPDLPAPPEGWAETLVTLEREVAALQARLDGLIGTRNGVAAERALLVPDPSVLAKRQAIEAAGTLRSAHDEGIKDLPARRSEAEVLSLRIGAALERLGRAGAEPAQVLPDRAAVADLRALIEARSGVVQAAELAGQELAQARAEAVRTTAELADGADAVGDVAPLAHLLRRLQDEAPAATLAHAKAALDAAQGLFDQRLRALVPWVGDGSALAGLVLPMPDVVAHWKARANAIAQGRAAATADLQRLEAALAQSVLPEVAGGVTPDAAIRARALREAAWAAHRVALDGETAAAFEDAMRRDDAITSGLAETLTEARRRAEVAVAQDALRHERGLAQARLAAIGADDIALQADIAAALSPCGLPPLPPDMLERWMALRLVAVEAWDGLVSARAALVRAEGAVAEARAGLVSALALAGVAVSAGDGLPVLMARAAAVCDAAAAQAAQVAAARRAEAQVAARNLALTAAEGALGEWGRRWSAALQAARLPPALDVAAARDSLVTLDALAADARAREELADRIAKMEANVAAFAGAVAPLAASLQMPPDAPARQHDAIARRLAAAVVTAQRITDVDAKLSAMTTEAAALERDLSGKRERIAAMVAGFGAQDAADLGHRLRAAAARVQALDEAARLAEALRQSLDMPTAVAARAALAGLSRDALTAEALRLEDEVTALGAAAQTAFATRAEAQRQLDAVGGDDAVLRLAEARETLLLQIAEGARDHLVRKLGLIAVEHGLRRYRDLHRSAMIEAASAAFRTMTRGAYSGLATQPDGAREVLLALAADGGSKRAVDLSKGTRFQLYLALRVAAYHERANLGPVPPFVADDIMETFDDDRAAEAFAVMAGMATRGQVIYLTHHRHLCDIARKVCPQVRVHRL